MATPLIPTPEAGIEAARAALTAAMSPSPVSAPVPTPVPAPPVQAAPVSVPTAPVQGTEPSPSPIPTPSLAPAPGQTVPPTAPAQPALSLTDPNARHFLEMHGGNVEAALAAALRYNNRLASLAKASPDLFKPGAPADPSLSIPPEQSALFEDPAATMVTTPVSATLDWEQITADVDSLVNGDATCQSLINAWRHNAEIIQSAAKQVEEKANRLSYLSGLLDDKSIDLSELKHEELSDERRHLAFDVNTIRQDAMLRAMTNRDIDTQFRDHRRAIFDSISTTHQARVQEQATQAELTNLETAEFQRLSQEWPVAIAASIQSAGNPSGIPTDLRADFESYAKQVAQATRATDPSFVIGNVASFVTGIVPQYLQRLETYHRAQAAIYATSASTRAATPSPTPPPGTSAAPTLDPARMTPDEIMEGIALSLRERMRG